MVEENYQHKPICGPCALGVFKIQWKHTFPRGAAFFGYFFEKLGEIVLFSSETF